jgi:hypothetical protein
MNRTQVKTLIKVDIKFVTDVQTGEPRIWSEGAGNAILKAEVNEKETFGILFDLLGKYFVKANMELSGGERHAQVGPWSITSTTVWEGTVTGGTFKGQNINPQLEMTRVIKDGDSIQVALDAAITQTAVTPTVGCCVIA